MLCRPPSLGGIWMRWVVGTWGNSSGRCSPGSKLGLFWIIGLSKAYFSSPALGWEEGCTKQLSS
jgi:hypothetical protein